MKSTKQFPEIVSDDTYLSVGLKLILKLSSVLSLYFIEVDRVGLLDERVTQFAGSKGARVSMPSLFDGSFSSSSFLVVIKVEQFSGFDMGSIVCVIDFEIIEGPNY